MQVPFIICRAFSVYLTVWVFLFSSGIYFSAIIEKIGTSLGLFIVFYSFMFASARQLSMKSAISRELKSDMSPVVFILDRYSVSHGAGRDGYQERERKLRWVRRKRRRKTPLLPFLSSPALHLACCCMLYEDDWGRVRS